MKDFNRVYMNEESGAEAAGGGGEEVVVAESSPPESLIGDKDISLGEGEFFLAENIKGAGDKPEWYLADKYNSVSDQAKAYVDLHKKFGGFTGTPKDGYKTPEGIESDDALLQQYVELATSSNMNQETFDKGFELIRTQMSVNQELSVEGELKKLGDNAEQRINQVEQFLRNNVKDAADFETIQGMANTADNIMLIEKMINVLAPRKLPIDGGDHPEGLTFDKVMEMSMKKDPSGRLLRSVDADYNAKIERLMQELGGDSQNHVVVG